MNRQRTRSMQSLHNVPHLPVIEELDNISDTTEPPKLPEKSPRRPKAYGFASLKEHMYPPFPPPAYSIKTPPGTSSTGTGTGKEAALPKSRNPLWLTKRGGWWRLAFVTLIGVVCVVALVLGLVLGLRLREYVMKISSPCIWKTGTLIWTYSSSKSGSASGANTTYALQFPAGSYSFNTALANISTSCTSNANTFRCYPYTTYNVSGTGASATFSWSITQVAASPTTEYVISAQPNPFVPQFTNITMAVLDRGTDAERLAFDFPLDLAITPAAALDSSDRVATCWFNSTVMSATIYTRRRAEFPVNTTSSVNATNPSSDFAAWPFAVEIEQNAPAGSGVPDCVDSAGTSLGDFAVLGGGGSCGCVYSNYGLES